MKQEHILRIFTNKLGEYGDLASIVIDEGHHIPDDKRQDMARKLNTGETIFINNIADANISVMHPQGEIDFAGVGVLAASWLLTKLRDKPTEQIHGRGGIIATRQDGDLTWVRANLTTMPSWNYQQLDSVAAVEQMKLEDTTTLQHIMVWAWEDEAKGLIRARTFAADWDIPEAEGNGSGAMVLGAKLDRSVEIRHGKGSVIFAKPTPGGYADVGGWVVEVEGTTILTTDYLHRS